jgi:AcrR family transcriptional regulator
MTQPDATRTPRGLATQAALVRAARQVFERDGFIDARIADITACAGTATGSFYTYFSSKEEIFGAVVDELSDEGLHPPSMEYLAEGDGDLVARIAEHHRAYLRAYQRNAKMMSVIEQVTSISDDFRRRRTERAQEFMEANVAVIRRLQRDGLADADLDPLTTARALSAMVSRSAFVTFVLEQESRRAIDGLAATLTRLWANALRIAQ